jgi:hypothetical protein
VVSKAAGAAAARLVCAEQVAIARRLAPYLTHGLPLEPLSSEPLTAAPQYAEFNVQPLYAWWLEERAGLSAQLELLQGLGPTAKEAHGVGLALFDEVEAFLASTKSVQLESRFLDNGDFSSSLRVQFDDTPPWLVEGYLETADTIAGPTKAFEALPSEVQSSGYDYALPPRRAAELQSAVVRLAKAALREFGPVSERLGDFDPRAARAIDAAAPKVLAALESPCLASSRRTRPGRRGASRRPRRAPWCRSSGCCPGCSAM